MLKEILLAALGASGFAILFGMKRTKIWIIFLASGLSWCGYLMLRRAFEDDMLAMFFITIFVVVLANVITIFGDGPVILFSTPILIPFIPGALLYRVMDDLVSKKDRFALDMWELLCQVGAMALGILVVEMIMIVINGKKHRIYECRVEKVQ